MLQGSRHDPLDDSFTAAYCSTIGVDFATRTLSFAGRLVKLQIWDTAGHDDLGRLRPIAYAGTKCFIICFSLMQRNSLNNACKKWMSEVKTTARTCPCILVGTKLDLREEL